MPIVKLYAMSSSDERDSVRLVLAPVAATLGLLSVPFGRLADRWGKLAYVMECALRCGDVVDSSV